MFLPPSRQRSHTGSPSFESLYRLHLVDHSSLADSGKPVYGVISRRTHFISGSQEFRRFPCVQIPILLDEVYMVHGSKNIQEIFRNQRLTMTRAYGIALKHCFGMKSEAVEVYMSDTSGARQKPIPGSKVPDDARIGLLTHQNLSSIFSGTGLERITGRFEDAFKERLHNLPIGDGWNHFPDFTSFVETQIGAPILRALFGRRLLDQSGFLESLFVYDRHIMNLARRLPFLLAPRAYRARRRVLRSIKTWHQEVKQAEHADDAPYDKRKDSAWGSDTMRDRHRILSQITRQDADALASADLALIWA